MVAYGITFALVALVLWACYRAFGGGVPAEVPAAGIAAVVHQELSDALAAAAEPGGASTLRRLGVVATQRLAQISEGDADDNISQLTAAAENIVWAGRLMESDAYENNQAISQAADLLLEHAAQCLSRVQTVDGLAAVRK